MFCRNCGTQVSADTKFCPNCGQAQNIAAAPSEQSNATSFKQETTVGQINTVSGNGNVCENLPAIGFSDRVNHPEILAAIKKSRKSAGAFGIFIVPLPLLGFIIYSLISNNMEFSDAFKYGAFVSVVFLVFALYSFAKERAKNTYEATVIDKKTRETHRNNNSNSDDTVMEYITVVRTIDGKKKKIVEFEGSQIWAYNYLNIGDRFKYHPQFHFPYELYDKSNAPYIACVDCGTKNPKEADRCSKCGLPLLK